MSSKTVANHKKTTGFDLSFFQRNSPCGEWNLASPSEIASLWNICFANVRRRISFHIEQSEIFHNFRKEIISHSATPNISLKSVWVRILNANRKNIFFVAFIQKNALLSTDKGAFFEWCLPVTQMMLATPMMTSTPNDVCLTAHCGKHRIIAERSGATSYLQSKCIMSPQAMHHF